MITPPNSAATPKDLGIVDSMRASLRQSLLVVEMQMENPNQLGDPLGILV